MEDEKELDEKLDAENSDSESDTATDDATDTASDVKDNTDLDIDYDAEFEKELARFENAEKNREGYQKRQQEKKNESKEDIKAVVAEAIKEALPALEQSLAGDQIDQILNSLSSSEAEKKLIRLHFENSVSENGTIRERLENAKLIANKQAILKTQKEMALALQNRQGISSSGQGSSSDVPQVKDNFFSKDQLAELRARGYDDAKLERLKQNLRNRIN